MNTQNNQAAEESVREFYRLWKTIEAKFDVLLTLHDHCGILRSPENVSLLPEIGIHHHPCCVYCREKLRQQCTRYCKVQTREAAAAAKDAFLSECPMGMFEALLPLRLDDRHVGTIFGGTFRTERIPGKWHFTAGFLRHYNAMPFWDESRREEIFDALKLAGNAWLRLGLELRSRYKFAPGRKGVIQRFFSENAPFPVGIDDLAQKLNLSVSHTSHLLKKYFGTGFRELLNHERIGLAEKILESSPEIKIYELAGLCGFSNEYYFTRVFTLRKGISPGRFRSQLVQRHEAGDRPATR